MEYTHTGIRTQLHTYTHAGIITQALPNVNHTHAIRCNTQRQNDGIGRAYRGGGLR